VRALAYTLRLHDSLLARRKAKDAAKLAGEGPVVKALTHAQIKERDGNAMRAKLAAANAAKEAAGK
jgi:hypothetical protein